MNRTIKMQFCKEQLESLLFVIEDYLHKLQVEKQTSKHYTVEKIIYFQNFKNLINRLNFINDRFEPIGKKKKIISFNITEAYVLFIAIMNILEITQYIGYVKLTLDIVKDKLHEEITNIVS